MELIDIFGPELKLHIESNSKFNSKLGGIFSIIFFMLSGTFFFAFGRDIFEKKNPVILFNKVYKDNPQYEFNSSSIFLFTVVDQSILPIADLDRNFHFYIQLIDSDPKRVDGPPTKLQNVDFVKCDASRFQNLSYFLFVPIEKYYCTPKNLTNILKGSYGIGKNNILRVQVDICKNTTQNGNFCFSPDYIRKNLPSVFNFQYIVFDSYMDGFNYTNPEYRIINSGIAKSNINSFTRLFIWLKNIEYYTDMGWIFQDIRSQFYTSVERIYSEVYPTLNTTTFFSHIISLSTITETYSRQYTKIQDAIAKIGGFVSFLLYIFATFNKYLTYPDIVKIFFNSYYSLENKIKLVNILKKDESISMNINPTNLNLEERNMPRINVEFSTENPNVDLKLNENTKINNYVITKELKEKIEKVYFDDFSIWDKIVQFKCTLFSARHNQKMDKFVKYGKKFIEKMSLEHIIKINKKLDLLCYLLLENHQIDLMKYSVFIKKKDQSPDKILKSLRRLKNSLNLVDKKMYEILDPRVYEI